MDQIRRNIVLENKIYNLCEYFRIIANTKLFEFLKHYLHRIVIN